MAAIAAGLFAIVIAGQASFAAPVPWTTPSGSTSKITYSNGQSDNGLYGDPTLTGGTFQFVAPHNFVATAANGSAATTSDRLSFTVTTTTGDLASINVQEYGSWSVLGAALARESGGLFVTRLDPGHFGVLYQQTPNVMYTNVDTGEVYGTSNFPTNTGTGTWKATYMITLPAGTRTVAVALNNVLSTTSNAGTTSSIQKDAVSITAVTASVPEPASLAALALGGAALLRRRRA